MPFSQLLAARVRDLADPRSPLLEKKMFGGMGYFLNGNLMVAVWGEALIVRLGIEPAKEALTRPNVRVFDVTGRPMKGWIVVDPAGLRHDRDVKRWLEKALQFVATLPAK